MLVPQVPDSILKGVSAELSVDLGVLRASIEHRSKAESTHGRLVAIERYLASQDLVGTVDCPKSYFRGTLMVKWGPIGEGRAVIFSGTTKRTQLLLGGSAQHVPGAMARNDGAPYVSSTPFLLREIAHEEKGIELNEREIENMAALTSRGRDYNSLVLSGVHHACDYFTGPTQKVKFLAKTLLRDDDSGIPSPGLKMLLGSPLYVAQED